MRLEEKIKKGGMPANVANLAYEDNLSGDESFDASWSTWKQPVTMPSNVMMIKIFFNFTISTKIVVLNFFFFFFRPTKLKWMVH